MKIAIYYSGCVRTLKHVVDHNIKVIRDNVGDCEIHTFYSFWDVTDKPVDVPDEWCRAVIGEYGEERHKDKPDRPGDVHPEYKSQNTFFPIESEDKIKELFIKSGSDFVEGEIESFDISKKIIEESKFLKIPKLASQYYKIHRVIEKYPPEEFDFCIRIRADVEINNFPFREDLDEALSQYGSILFINEGLWPGLKSNIHGYHGCNEMVWCATSNIFRDTCSIYLSNLEDIFVQTSGEVPTSKHFLKLLEEDVIKFYAYYDFKHQFLRFDKMQNG